MDERQRALLESTLRHADQAKQFWDERGERPEPTPQALALARKYVRPRV